MRLVSASKLRIINFRSGDIKMIRGRIERDIHFLKE